MTDITEPNQRRIQLISSPEPRFKYPSIWGVPYGKSDVKLTVDALRVSFTEAGYSPQQALEQVLDLNEKVVSRCGMLVHFSGVLIVLFLFLAQNYDHRILFYCTMLSWSLSTITLLWSLRHQLPRITRFGTELDFNFTARLYIRRMGTYNMCLVISVLCFGIVMGVLAPIRLDIRLLDWIATSHS